MLAFYHLAFEDFETLHGDHIIHVHARFGELDLSSKSQGREIILFQSFQCFRIVYKLAILSDSTFLECLAKKRKEKEKKRVGWGGVGGMICNFELKEDWEDAWF